MKEVQKDPAGLLLPGSSGQKLETRGRNQRLKKNQTELLTPEHSPDPLKSQALHISHTDTTVDFRTVKTGVLTTDGEKTWALRKQL